MKLVLIDELKGDETLAVPILSPANNVLIQSDTVLKDEYIEKLKSYNLSSVYVKDECDFEDEETTEVKLCEPSLCQTKSDETQEHFSIEETFAKSTDITKSILEKHIYKHNEELKKISSEADNIIKNVISEPKVINSITEIRNISTDMYTHCINVCILSTIMALRLKMNERQIRNISKGAILHDIGLKYIQAPYIDIEVGEMVPEDALEYKKHTIYGYSSIQEEEWLADVVKEIILLHHEQIGGNGFPFKQKGSKLKQEVKLVSLCDDFDSLISGIGNKKMKIYEAIEYIRVNKGIRYDSTIANKFLDTVAAYPVGTEVITNDGERGVVVRQNKEAIDRPVIKICIHSDGSPYEEPKELDLLKVLTVFIVDTL